MIPWSQADAMNDSRLLKIWTILGHEYQTLKGYEHLGAMNDRSDSWSWGQGFRWYEQLRSVVDMNCSMLWAKGFSVRIEPLKAWYDVINLEFIIYLMMFQFHYCPSLLHVLYSMSILALTFCIVHDLGAFLPSCFIVLSLNLERILSLCLS